MSKRVGRIVVLIKDNGVFDFSLLLSGSHDVRAFFERSLFSGGSDDFSTETLEDIDLFLRHLFRKSDQHLVSLDGNTQSQANTSITRGGFNKSGSGLELAHL